VASKSEKQRRMELRRAAGNRRFGLVAHRWGTTRGTYLIAHACFTCRKSFKLRPAEQREHRCPDCKGSVHEMGRSFRAPARSNAEQCEKVQALFAHGFRFYSYRSFECPPLPERLREVERFVRENPSHPLRIARPRPSLLPRSAA
jgi:DNA-directed RNA polymerase subunit RPC12/RpoP